MPLLNNNPTQTEAWKKLSAHFEEMSSFSIEKAFEAIQPDSLSAKQALDLIYDLKSKL